MSANRKTIIIGGYCATGKSTFAAVLSKNFGVPHFCKDDVKIALNRSIAVNKRADSRMLSAAAFDAMAFTAERLMESGLPLILEANFVMRPNHNGLHEGNALRDLISRYGYKSLTYIFHGDLEVLYRRFAARDVLPERGVANKMWGEYAFDDYLRDNLHLTDFDIGGRIVRIDTTDFASVDFEGYTRIAHEFLNIL